MSNPLDEYRSRLRDAVGIINDLKAKVASAERAAVEPIAIIGLGCRFPGGGEGPEAFWRVLEDGVDAIREIPAERWPADAIPGGRPEVRWAGLLDDVSRFDAGFFGISPREAETLDPQQRLLLEVTWEALEDAGAVPDRLVGTRAGVFVGLCSTDYHEIVEAARFGEFDAFCTTGNLHSTAAGRISFVLGLQGPSVSIDTACSSSLVAMAAACQSLRAGESNLAFAGGVNVILSSGVMAMLAATQALSPDGRCKTLDARANGFVRGEGCGVVVLKRLSDAQRDGDRIRAIIRGWAVNQDGRSTGLTAPNVLSQQSMLRLALENARLSPSDIGFVEMHGTGTSLGDPIEIEALKEVLGAPRADGSQCVLGACKTNIGHLEGAAGIAGLIKVVLAMEHERMPKNLHFKRLNPRISLDGTPFVVPAKPIAWPRGEKPRRAGVSGFGLSGTNAHIILEEAPRDENARAKEASAYLVPLSAKTPMALSALSRSFAKWLSARNDVPLNDIAYTASVRRMHHEHRLSVVGGTREEIVEQLASFSDEQAREVRAAPKSAPKVVFVFPGQGSQWLGMGRQLLEEEPSFRAALEACDAAIRAESGFSVLAEIAADEASSRLGEIDVVQPVLFAVQVSLAALFRSWGVVPDCVVGHSMGEAAAAHVAGKLSLADAAKVICRRSRLLRRISGKGAMALVELPMSEAEQAISGKESRLGVAVSNGPRSTVLSGDPDALEEVLSALEARGVFCRRVKVDVASHSPQVDPLQKELLAALQDLRPLSGGIAMRSTATGEALRGEELVASYWWENLRRPVRFSDVTGGLMRQGHAIFVEISPHPILLPSIEENLKATEVSGAAVASMRRQTAERASMLSALGALHARGREVSWDNLYPGGGRVVDLPSYAWQREPFWIEASRPEKSRSRRDPGGHPLLGLGFVPSKQPELHVWEQWLSVASFPYLADHRVQGQVVFPGAGYVELALAAASQVFGANDARIESISFDRMLALPEGGERLLQVALVEEGGGRATFTITSREATAKEWVEHASGALRVVATSSAKPEIERHEPWQARCSGVLERRAHYERMAARGLEYGKCFQGVERVWLGQDECLARIRLPEEAFADGYIVHPALLDACFQSCTGLLESALGEGTFVPVKVVGLRVHEPPGREAWVHGRIANGAPGEAPSISMMVRDDSGHALLEMAALSVQRLATATGPSRDPFADCVFEVSWQKKERAALPQPSSEGGSAWLVLLDCGGLGARVAELLRARGDRCVEVSRGEGYARLGEDRYRLDTARSEHWDRALQDAFGKRGCRGVLHCAALDGARFSETAEATLAADLRAGLATAMRLAQALLRQGWRDTPKLLLLSRGAQAAGERALPLSVSQATLWGFGRAVVMEQPDLGCVRIDLDWERSAREAEEVLAELLAETDEDQIALRPEGRYVARLVRGQWAKAKVERKEPSRGRPFRLETREPGVLEKLALRPIERRPPGPGEVEIEVEAAGLNFIDVMKAMGIYPGMDEKSIALGGECAGRVVALGDGVTGFEPGQEVIASAPSSFATHVTVRSSSVVRKPWRLSLEEAAASLVVFATVHWAFHHVGRLRRGERVLIHSATGGTGLAAIQYARAVGAEIFATAGTEEKRALLRSMGVEHVMDSRTLAFGDEILSRTGGRGVDVVLNSLAGDGWRESLRVLGPYGRFLDLSKTDIYQNSRVGLLPFRKSLTYTAIDLAGMAEERPELFGSVLREVMERFEDGTYQPEPMQVFPVSAAQDAFRSMALSRHVGKIVLRMKDSSAELAISGGRGSVGIRGDATYLITGGLGGLGSSLSRWLAERGARSIVLMGRSAPTGDAEAAMQRIREAGAAVRFVRGDVSRAEDLNAVMALIDRELPPLRGVVHAAAVLEDRTLPEMSEEQLFRPLGPKVFGGFFLHEATRARDLDFFVMYSSAAGLLGSPGQSNYAAGNAFLDALCHARAAEGLAGTSIQWGPFAEVGLAAASEIRGGRIASRGIESFAPEDGNEIFDRLLEHPRSEIAAMRIDVRRWVEFYPQMAGSPFLSELASGGAAAGVAEGAASRFRDVLERSPARDRGALLEAHLSEALGKVLRLDPARLDRSAPFTSLGMDSLMSLELRNRLEVTLGLKLSAALLFTYSTSQALSAYLLQQLFPPKVGAEPAPEPARGAVEQPESIVADESAADVEDHADLIDKLEAFEEYLG